MLIFRSVTSRRLCSRWNGAFHHNTHFWEQILSSAKALFGVGLVPVLPFLIHRPAHAYDVGEGVLIASAIVHELTGVVVGVALGGFISHIDVVRRPG